MAQATRLRQQTGASSRVQCFPQAGRLRHKGYELQSWMDCVAQATRLRQQASASSRVQCFPQAGRLRHNGFNLFAIFHLRDH